MDSTILMTSPNRLRACGLRNKELRRRLSASYPSSRLSSEPLHDSISTDSKATSPSSSPPPRHCKASPETQLSQEGRLHTGRGVADEHELVDHALDTLLIDKGARKQQEVEQEQEKDEGNSKDEDGAAARDKCYSTSGNGRKGWWKSKTGQPAAIAPNLEQSLEPNYNEAGSRSDHDSDDGLNSANSAEDDEKKHVLAKRKAAVLISRWPNTQKSANGPLSAKLFPPRRPSLRAPFPSPPPSPPPLPPSFPPLSSPLPLSPSFLPLSPSPPLSSRPGPSSSPSPLPFPPSLPPSLSPFLSSPPLSSPPSAFPPPPFPLPSPPPFFLLPPSPPSRLLLPFAPSPSLLFFPPLSSPSLSSSFTPFPLLHFSSLPSSSFSPPLPLSSPSSPLLLLFPSRLALLLFPPFPSSFFFYSPPPLFSPPLPPPPPFLQQSSSRQRRPLSEPHRHLPQVALPLNDRYSRIATRLEW